MKLRDMVFGFKECWNKAEESVPAESVEKVSITPGVPSIRDQRFQNRNPNEGVRVDDESKSIKRTVVGTLSRKALAAAETISSRRPSGLLLVLHIPQ